MGWIEVSRPGITAAESPKESATFGFATARLTVGAGTHSAESQNLRAVLDYLLSKNQLVITRWASDCVWVPALLGRPGFQLIPNTTLVYWSISLDQTSFPEPETNIDRAPPSELISSLIADIFDSYPNHYTTNPYLPQDSSIRAYLDWAQALALDPKARVICLSNDDGEQAMIGATVDLRAYEPVTEVLLAGVSRKNQRKNLYGRVMAAMCLDAHAHGSSRLVISTQADNDHVQKAWIRAGLRPALAVDGCHLISETITG